MLVSRRLTRRRVLGKLPSTLTYLAVAFVGLVCVAHLARADSDAVSAADAISPTSNPVGPSLVAPDVDGALEGSGSSTSAPGSDGTNLEDMRRRAEERIKFYGAGKSGEKHLRHELSRMGFDIGEALRTNLRNTKQPSPTTPQIGNKLKVKVPCRRQADKTLRTILGQAYNARYMAFVKPGAPKGREIFDDVPSIADAFVGDQPAADDPEALPFSVDSGYRQVLEGQVMIHHHVGDDAASNPSNVHFSRSRRDVTAGNDTSASVSVSVSDAVANDTSAFPDAVNGTAKTPAELLLEKTSKLKGLKRTKENGDLWSCKYELRWTDLGQDHYPRYLREAVCMHKKCWFGQFECRPKAFTVKVLKRWSDSCEITNEQYLHFVSSAKGSGSYDFSEQQHDHGDMAVESIDHDVPPELQEKWVWEEIGVNFCCECTNIYA